MAGRISKVVDGEAGTEINGIIRSSLYVNRLSESIVIPQSTESLCFFRFSFSNISLISFESNSALK
jgi:hypothetical protein